ncbi:MAG TPA: DoxX family protein [Sphingomicrobium sp.]
MKTAAILVARLIFAGVFLMSAAFKFKFVGMDATAGEIAAAGFPMPMLLAWVAAFFEVALAIGFLTGLYFSQTAIVAAAYVLFLGVSFHGPDRWSSNPMEFGFFVDHFTFIAGLLFAAVHGPGGAMVLRPKLISRRI